MNFETVKAACFTSNQDQALQIRDISSIQTEHFSLIYLFSKDFINTILKV